MRERGDKRADNKFSKDSVIARCAPMGRLQAKIPPKVEYSPIELGESFIPVLQTMMAWSESYLCPDYKNPYTE